MREKIDLGRNGTIVLCLFCLTVTLVANIAMWQNGWGVGVFTTCMSAPVFVVYTATLLYWMRYDHE